MSSTPHDALFKSVFSKPEHVAGELRYVLPAALTAQLDFATLKLHPGSFIDEGALREQLTDLLFTIKLAGQDAFIYVLFEHQSKHEPLMAFRLLRYMVRIWETHLKTHPRAAHLPMIIPLVLSQGEPGWRVHPAFESLYDAAPEALAAAGAHALRFRFALDDLRRTSDEALRDRAMSELGRLALWCLRNAWRPQVLIEGIRSWVGLVKEVLRAPNGLAALEQIVRYILTVHPERQAEEIRKQLLATVEEEEVNAAMKSALDYFIEKGHRAGLQEGRQEGRQEGLAEGKRQTLLVLLGERFGPVPTQLMARIEAAGADDLERWARRILSAQTAEDVLA